MDNIETLIETISTLAPQVAAQTDELHSAIAAERAAEAALLEAAIAAAKPALRALGSRVKSRDYESRNDHLSDGEVEYHEGRYVPLTDDTFCPKRIKVDSDSRGRYGASDVGVRVSDGALVLVQYSGHWSQWVSESTELLSEISETDAATVARERHVPDLIEQLAKLLRAHAEGRAPERAQQARARAERLAAIAALAR